MKDNQLPQYPGSAGIEQVVRQFTRKLFLTITIKHSVLLISIWCFIWGTIALALRATSILTGKILLWGGIGIAVAIVAAAVMAKRQGPERRAVEALLDQRNGCGGLLMATADAEIGEWRRQLPALVAPRLQLRNARALGRAVGMLSASVIFVAISLLAPVRLAGTNAARPLDVSKEAENLSAQIESMRETQILEEPKAEELKQKLEQLAAEASGEDPAKTWEALDHLADAVEKAAKDAVENAEAREAQLDRAQALAEGLASGGDQLDAKTMTEAMQTLSAMMQSAMKNNEMLSERLSHETQEALKSGALKPENLNEMAKALKQNK